MDQITSMIDHPYVEPEPNSGCWLWAAARTKAGYPMLTQRQKHFYGHRLSWEMANGPIPPRMQVCHRCNNPACVNPDHLFLGTHKDNMDHRDACGRNPRGEQIGNSVLVAAHVAEIRALLKEGWAQQTIAEAFGVHQMTISDIKRGKTWRAAA